VFFTCNYLLLFFKPLSIGCVLTNRNKTFAVVASFKQQLSSYSLSIKLVGEKRIGKANAEL
jgi:hypothetical protein